MTFWLWIALGCREDARGGGRGSSCADVARAMEDAAATFDGEMERMELPGGVFVAVSGDCSLVHPYGLADPDGTPVATTTRFQIASMTKTLTAVTALAMEEDAVIDRAAPASTWLATLEDRAPYSEPFTLEDLLAHRSGLPGDYGDASFAITDLVEYFDTYGDQPLWAPPGEVYYYNNGGYALAGLLLQEAAGEPFAGLMDRYVLEPAGLADARIGTTLDPEEPGFALGTMMRPGGRTIGPSDRYLRSTLYEPEGGVWLSGDDLARFAQAWLGGELISAAARDDMATSRGPTDGATGGYGQGLGVGPSEVFHSGAYAGFLSDLHLQPDAGFAVGVLVGGDWDLPQACIAEASAALAAPIGEEAEVVTPPSELVGAYDNPVTFGELVVSEDAGDLSADFVDLGFTSPLTRVWSDVYTFRYEPWGPFPVYMSFQRGSDGTLYFASNAGVAPRTSP